MICNSNGLLILSSPRSGGTNLMISMSSAYSLGYIFEPTDLNSILNEKKIIKYVPKVIFNNEKDISVEIDYYEDLYYGNGLKNRNIKLDLTLFDKKYKLRQMNGHLI
jgi:hypothetical protein